MGYESSKKIDEKFRQITSLYCGEKWRLSDEDLKEIEKMENEIKTILGHLIFQKFVKENTPGKEIRLYLEKTLENILEVIRDSYIRRD